MIKPAIILGAIATLLSFTGVDGVFPATEAAVGISAPAERTQVPGVVRIGRATDGLFYITLSVNDAPVRFIVDTGATVVVLTAEDAQRAGLRNRAGAASMETTGGREAMRWVVADRVALAGDTYRDIDVAIIESGASHSLLGQNLLSQLGTLTIDGDNLYLSKHARGGPNKSLAPQN